MARFNFESGYPLGSIGNPKDEQRLAKWSGIILFTIALALIALELTGTADVIRNFIF